jgi:hypothetical protein
LNGTRRLVVAALVAGAVLRAIALPLPGTPDVGSWKIWTFEGASDPTALYGVGGSPPERRLLDWHGLKGTTEYPPFALYQMGAVGAIYQRIDPAYTDSWVLTALVKAPGLLTEVAFVAALLTWGRRRFGDGAVWTAIAFWVNPAIILNGAVLGYLDAQMAVPAALALLAASAGRPGIAGALAAAAVLTKAQAVFVLPFVAIVAAGGPGGWRGRPFGRMIAGGAIVSVALVLPIVLRGAVPNMMQAIGRLGAHDMLSGNALNVWWIITWLLRAAFALEAGWWAALSIRMRILGVSRFIEIGFPNPKPIGAGIVMAAWGWALWRVRREPALAVVALAATWALYAYTMFNVQVHENHLYLAVPIAAVAAGLDARFRPIFYGISTITAVNMYLFYGFGDGWPPVVDHRWTVIDLSVLLAVANLAYFAWATRTFVRASGRS